VESAELLLPQYNKVRYFVEDESRFGLKTLSGRKITVKGVKPIGEWIWRFQAFWIYGAVEPLSGESCFWQFSHVDTECYQQFLENFSATYPDTLNILQVDNGLFHKAKRLKIPENIILLFQPPHCPELNPIERVWEHLKQDLKWELFEDLEQLQIKVSQLLEGLNCELLASLTSYDFILEALDFAKIS
jgi:transposase